MSDLRQAAELALQALKELQYAVIDAAATEDVSLYYRAIVALSAALANHQEEAQASRQDDEMVPLGGSAPSVPRWLLDAVQRIERYMDAYSHGDWAIGGIQKRQAAIRVMKGEQA